MFIAKTLFRFKLKAASYAMWSFDSLQKQILNLQSWWRKSLTRELIKSFKLCNWQKSRVLIRYWVWRIFQFWRNIGNNSSQIAQSDLTKKRRYSNDLWNDDKRLLCCEITHSRTSILSIARRKKTQHIIQI